MHECMKTHVTVLHPGQLIADAYLVRFAMTAQALADAIGVPGNRITDIIRERRGISADTAIRLGIFFGNGWEYWLKLQAEYDVNVAEMINDYSTIKQRCNKS
jgi:addiction module HigA family antidote